MNPFILCLTDGTSFFVGLAMTLVADLFLLRFRTGRMRAVLTVLALVGIFGVGLSATPQPLWAYVVWGIAAVAALVAGNLAKCPHNLHRVLAGLVAVATLAFSLAEFPYQRLPQMTVPRGATVYVIGDSISAGLGPDIKCWPAVLVETTSLTVVNLAQPGATVQSALKQADGVIQSHALVILEIGGNDILGTTDAATFQQQLDTLMAALQSHQCQFLLLELPLLPLQNAFGKAQRTIATKFSVHLLPKRCFSAVLGTKNGTLDGVHLSQEGHHAMARTIARVIQVK